MAVPQRVEQSVPDRQHLESQCRSSSRRRREISRILISLIAFRVPGLTDSCLGNQTNTRVRDCARLAPAQSAFRQIRVRRVSGAGELSKMYGPKSMVHQRGDRGHWKLLCSLHGFDKAGGDCRHRGYVKENSHYIVQLGRGDLRPASPLLALLCGILCFSELGQSWYLCDVRHNDSWWVGLS